MFRFMKNIYKLRAEKLYWAIGYVIMSAIYIKNSIGRNNTYCNIAAYDLFDSRCRNVWINSVKIGESKKINLPMGNIIKAYDYDISSIMPGRSIKNILNAPISEVYRNCMLENGRGVLLVSSRKAQELANRGIPIMVISKKYNHVAIVCPDVRWNEKKGSMSFQPFDPAKGVFTGNAGENNDYMYMNDTRGFGSLDWKNTEIKYVQFKIYGNKYFER